MISRLWIKISRFIKFQKSKSDINYELKQLEKEKQAETKSVKLETKSLLESLHSDVMDLLTKNDKAYLDVQKQIMQQNERKLVIILDIKQLQKEGNEILKQIEKVESYSWVPAVQKDKDMFISTRKKKLDQIKKSIIDKVNGILGNDYLTPLSSIDLLSLELQGFYLVDKYNVYRPLVKGKIEKLQNADPRSFQIVNDIYCKDNNNVYYKGNTMELLDKADPKSLKSMAYTYMKDMDKIYCMNEDRNVDKIEGADIASFEIINNKYSKDNNSVYRLQERIVGADPYSFEVIEGEKTKDKNNLYFYGIKAKKW